MSARKTYARILGVGVTLALSLATQAAGQFGYQIEDDYLDAGPGWTGGLSGPEQRYDYPPRALDLFLSGADFNGEYDPVFDVLGLGPPLERRRTRHSMYSFRFSLGGGFGGPPPLDVCGDLDGSGVVDSADVEMLRSFLADPSAGSLSVAARSRCSVIGTADDCDILDVTVLRRVLAAPPLPPEIAPVCEAVAGP